MSEDQIPELSSIAPRHFVVRYRRMVKPWAVDYEHRATCSNKNNAGVCQCPNIWSSWRLYAQQEATNPALYEEWRYANAARNRLVRNRYHEGQVEAVIMYVDWPAFRTATDDPDVRAQETENLSVSLMTEVDAIQKGAAPPIAPPAKPAKKSRRRRAPTPTPPPVTAQSRALANVSRELDTYCMECGSTTHDCCARD